MDSQQHIEQQSSTIPLLHFRYVETLSRGRTYQKKLYYCMLCPFQSNKKQNASVHEKIKKHNHSYRLNQQINIPRTVELQPSFPLIPELIPEGQEWDPSKQNVTYLVKSLIQPLLQENVGIKDFATLAKQILLPIQTSLINNMRAALASALQSVYIENQNYEMHPNQLRLSILQLASSVDFQKLVVNFQVKLNEAHKKIQEGLNKHERTYKNNQNCFAKIKSGTQMTFRNRIKSEQFLLTLSKFQRRDCIRYWNMLKKKESYFSQFPAFPILSEKKIERARIIPKSMLQVKTKLEAILQHNPKLGADMLIIIGLGLRRTDLHKIMLWDEQGYPVKFLRIIQNKNKNLTERYVPSSIIRIAKYAGITFPLSAARIKNGVKACLSNFKTCYGFRHRVLSNTIGALMGSASFLNFHRRYSTTLKYYIQTEDEKLLDRALFTGIDVVLPQAEDQKIEGRNLILDATRYPEIKFVTINQPTSITFQSSEESEERALSTIADHQIPVQQEELSEYKIHAGEISYVAEASTANLADEPDFRSIRSAIGSISSPELYEQIQDDVLSIIQTNKNNENEVYAQSLADIASVNILYAEFERDKIKPRYQNRIERQDNSQQILITIIEGPEEKIHIVNDTNQHRMQLRRRQPRREQQEETIIYKREPLCNNCKQKGQVSFLLAQDDLIKCMECQYAHFYDLENRSQAVKFISTGPLLEQKICVPKLKNMANNIKEHLKDKFSIQSTYSKKLPGTLRSNFFNFQSIRNEIRKFYQNINHMPFEIKQSTVAEAGLGMYTTEEVVSGSIVGAYVGHVCHSFEVNNASDSIFQIGWYKQGFVQYLVLCDGNVINQGSRFINSNRPKLCNCKVYLGVLDGKPINLIITSREVRKGEQLFFNYGSLYHFSKESQYAAINE